MERGDKHRIYSWLILIAAIALIGPFASAAGPPLCGILNACCPHWFAENFAAYGSLHMQVATDGHPYWQLRIDPDRMAMVLPTLLLLLGLIAYTLPAQLLLVGIGRLSKELWGFDLTLGPAWPMWLTLSLMILGSWLFWRLIAPRVLKLAGLWNPFRRSRKARPWSLRLWQLMRNWMEQGQFGESVTGRWAGLIEVLCWPYQRGDIFLGRPKLPWPLPGGLLRPIGIPTEKHMMTIAGSRLTSFDVLLVQMLRTPPGPYQEAIVAAAMSMDSMEERVRSNVLTTARTHTSFLDLPQIRKVLGSSSFRLADLRNARVSVYLCLPLWAGTRNARISGLRRACQCRTKLSLNLRLQMSLV
jgi:hypothetical protein